MSRGAHDLPKGALGVPSGVNHMRTAGVASIAVCLSLVAGLARGEILAMANYETKSEDSLKSLKLSMSPMPRREGIAVVDVDPESPGFGNWVMDIPLPPDLVAHHIFYNKDSTRAYVTALGKPEMRVLDLTANPYRMKTVSVPDCIVGEDVIFSSDNSTWYLTCMGSSKVVVGDTGTDEVKMVLDVPHPYPHGIALHEGINRLLVSNTVRASDLGDAGEMLVVLDATTGEALGSHKLSNKESPSGEAPVEILFVPGADPAVAYITNMYGGNLWAAVWDPAAGDFTVQQVFDFAPTETGVPLEIYFNDDASRLYVTTAKPGNLHVFDLAGGPLSPKLVKSLPTGEGAHHVAFTKDGRYAFVQNALLNLPGMSDGSITVVDLETLEVKGSVDTFKNAGYNPNSLVLLPEWNHPAGH